MPIRSKILYERLVIDLIDFTLKPSHGYHYILHCVDHCSKFHWAWPLKNKQPASVAFHLATLLADIGPVRFVQCDQGQEFVASVLDVLQEWGCGAPLRRAPYHPQTNGLVERGNGMLKSALDHWFIQERTTDWYPPLARIRYQINCTRPRTTQISPYELVYSRKPPSWDGMNVAAPLSPATLNAMLEEDAARAAGTASTSGAISTPPTEAAASILRSMAAGQPTPTQPQPAPSSQLPTSTSQLPDPSSQLPAADTEDYPVEVVDLVPGQPGPLNLAMANELNVGGCHFVRLGGEGSGRCAISAFYNALSPMDYLHLTSAQRRKEFDAKRKQLREMWEKLNTDTRAPSASKRKRLRDMIFELGNSGASHDETVEVAMPTANAGELQREQAWAQLGQDLSDPTKSLGTDAIAVMGREHNVNVLLYLYHTQTYDYGDGTPIAAERWAAASADEKKAQMALHDKTIADGRWLEERSSTTSHLVPCYIVQDAPWMVLYQRVRHDWTLHKGDAEAHTAGGTGHYEAVVKRTTTSAGQRTVDGLGHLMFGEACELEPPSLRVLSPHIRWSATDSAVASAQHLSFTLSHAQQHTPALLHYRALVTSRFERCARNG